MNTDRPAPSNKPQSAIRDPRSNAPGVRAGRAARRRMARRRCAVGDARALLALLAGTLLFLLPGLCRWEGMLLDDGPLLGLPRIVGAARSVQAGALPLWDRATFCGARPFYVMNESPIYNVLMYPFLLVADLSNLGRAVQTLYLLPFCLFVLLASAGTFLFARLTLRLARPAAALMALVYALGPHIGVSMRSLMDTCAFAWLPWMLLGISRYMATRRLGWWLAGAVFPALMACACDTNYTIRLYLVAGFATTLASALDWRNGGSALRGFVGAVLMLLLSLGLAGVMWGGVLEGIGWMRDGIEMSYASTVESIDSNLGPPFLVTMLIPNFFGALRGTHAWGSGLCQDGHGLLAGGTLVMFAAAVALLLLRRTDLRRRRLAPARRWAWIALALFACALLAMMGRYTPVYRLLCFVLPWFFCFPHPVYYGFAQCWAVSVLAGIGLHLLLKYRCYRICAFNLRFAARYAGIVLVLAGLALAWKAPVGQIVYRYKDGLFGPRRLERQATMLNIRAMRRCGETGRFLAGPALHFAAAAVFLAAVLPRFRRRRLRAPLFAAGMLLEIVGIGYVSFYKNTMTPRPGSLRDERARMYGTRFRRPDQHPDYRLAAVLPKLFGESNPPRFMAREAELGNLAWLTGCPAAMGYDAKPLAPRMQKVLQQLTKGWPTGLELVGLPLPFARNMHAGFMLSDVGLKGADRLRKLPAAEGWDLYILPEPLPYVYTQDTVVSAGTNHQTRLLLGADCAAAATLAPQVARHIPRASPAAALEPADKVRVRWQALQAQNKLLAVDRGHPNRLVVEAEIRKPALLVIAETYHEGWRATIDKQPAELLRVNYLQQGVWLEQGRHRVELRFFPRSLKIGATVSAGSFGILLLVGAAGLVVRALQRRRIISREAKAE